MASARIGAWVFVPADGLVFAAIGYLLLGLGGAIFFIVIGGLDAALGLDVTRM